MNKLNRIKRLIYLRDKSMFKYRYTFKDQYTSVYHPTNRGGYTESNPRRWNAKTDRGRREAYFNVGVDSE